MVVCRFCKTTLACSVIVPGCLSIGTLFDDKEAEGVWDRAVCTSKECSDKYSVVCDNVHSSCSHECIFHQGHKSCPGCTHPSCSKNNTSADTCCICLEELASAPCVKLNCEHIVHYQCIKDRLQLKWDGPISLTYAACPLCKADLDWDGYCSTLTPAINHSQTLRKAMTAKCEAQIGLEKIETKLPSLEYGMQHFDFFECHKCTCIYFGGKRECALNIDMVYEKEQFLCGGCTGCAQHGLGFMQYKCRYCCKLAEWFCFGHTHFCDYCHDRVHELAGGRNFEHLKKNPAQCCGKDSCPLGIDHAPNGEEAALFCKLCNPDRTFKQAALPKHTVEHVVQEGDVLAGLEVGGGLGLLFGEAAAAEPPLADDANQDFVFGHLWEDEELIIGDLFGDLDDNSNTSTSLAPPCDRPSETGVVVTGTERMDTQDDGYKLLLVSANNFMYNNWRGLTTVFIAALLNYVCLATFVA